VTPDPQKRSSESDFDSGAPFFSAPRCGLRPSPVPSSPSPRSRSSSCGESCRHRSPSSRPSRNSCACRSAVVRPGRCAFRRIALSIAPPRAGFQAAIAASPRRRRARRSMPARRQSWRESAGGASTPTKIRHLNSRSSPGQAVGRVVSQPIGRTSVTQRVTSFRPLLGGTEPHKLCEVISMAGRQNWAGLRRSIVHDAMR
jgi:hypothetical protein